MKSGKYIRSAVTAMFLAVTAASCFTGIESTPKITANDVKRDNAATGADDGYLSGILPQNIAQWNAGKPFLVTDSKIGYALAVEPSSARLLPGDTLRFASASESVSILGQPSAELVFNGPRGTRATFRSDYSLATLRGLDGAPTIPFTVDLDVVEAVRRKMSGQEYFVLTSDWYDLHRSPRRGRKFVKVRATEVQPGSESAPVCVILTDMEHTPADTFALMLSLGDGIASTRRFSSTLSTSDPRRKYPEITDANWQLIKNGRVAPGMTRNEVRLSLGHPKNVERHAGYSSLGEVWTYDSGIYLIFEDGLLKSFRR